MRAKLALAAAVAGAATALAPAPASAVCFVPLSAVPGHCSPSSLVPVVWLDCVQ